jgi:uncharacterized membrane protein
MFFFPKCAANHVFFPEFTVNHGFSEYVLQIMLYNLGKKHDWQHILVKNMVSSTFLGKNMIVSTFWVKNMICSTFTEKP